MVKIIEDNYVNRCVCENCNNVLEYDLEDVIHIVKRNPENYIICPVCQRRTEISNKEKISNETDSCMVSYMFHN